MMKWLMHLKVRKLTMKLSGPRQEHFLLWLPLQLQ